eukprot:g44854.t1
MYLLPGLRWGRALLSCLELLCIAAARDSGSRRPPLLLEAQVWEDSRPGSRVAGLRLCGGGLQAAGAGLRCELSGEAHSDFRLSPAHAACGSTLRTAAPLDREVRSTYLLGLNCSWGDGVSPGARGGVPAALVRVRVRDVNDNRPVFSPGLALRLEVDELTAVGSELAQVTATDNDEGSNAAIVYSQSPPVPQLFVVPGTGQILVVDSLLGALPLWLSVYARDKGANSRLSEPLTVLLQQELAPGLRRDTRSLSQEMVHSVTVPEGDKLGNVIYTIPDWKFERRWFEVIAPDDAPVQIERDSGRVYLSKRLRGTSTVQITVKVSNQK